MSNYKPFVPDIVYMENEPISLLEKIRFWWDTHKPAFLRKEPDSVYFSGDVLDLEFDFNGNFENEVYPFEDDIII